MIRRIREQLVVLINPVSNPDGRDKVVEWFYRFLKGKTDYAALPRQSPPYWSKLRVRGHQPRRAPAGPRGHEGGAPHVPRVAPHRGPRPARGHRAAAHLERHRALQPAHRPHHPRRVPGAEPSRGADPDRARHARRVDLELRRGLRPPLPRLGGHEPQQPSAAATRRSATPPRRRCGGRSTRTDATQRVVPAAARRRAEFTWSARDNVNYTQTAALAALDYVGAATRRRCCATSTARAGTRGARAWRSRPTRS